MKKIIFLVLIAVASVLLLSQGTSFAVGGVCSTCHTMHNSQNGTYMAKDYLDAADSTANDYLLLSDCIGCHASTNTAASTTTYGGPVVWHTAGAPTVNGGVGLAGGDFYWVRSGTGATAPKGHNVKDIPGMVSDANIGYTPPGFDAAATAWNFNDGGVSKTMQVGSTWNSTNQLTCSGTYGCHGTRDKAGFGGVQGAHHANKTNNVVSSTPSKLGNSYRFLAGIWGQEATDWQASPTTTSHNEYYGVAGNVNYATKTTISYFCGECHGVFHKDINGSGAGASPWSRHPTDIYLPEASEYAAYNTYSVEAPVARPTITGTVSSVVTGGSNAIVMCLSCHRAHGSANNDLLRWDYATMQAGGGLGNTGCFTCHTTKDNAP